MGHLRHLQTSTVAHLLSTADRQLDVTRLRVRVHSTKLLKVNLRACCLEPGLPQNRLAVCEEAILEGTLPLSEV